MTNEVESNENDSAESEIVVEIEEGGDDPTPEPSPEFDPSKDRVDFDKITDPVLREQVKAKVGNLYKQTKMSDQRGKMYWDMIEKQNTRLEELEIRFKQTDHAEAETIIMSRLKEARESGEDDKADRILQELVDFRIEQKLTRSEKSEKPAKLDPEMERMQSEVMEAALDESGNLAMPWLAADNPKHKQAMSMAPYIAAQVQAELGYPDIGEVMRRVDQNIKKSPAKQAGNSRAPDPMRGGLTNKPTQKTIKLSQAELAMASKLGVKPEAYAKYK